MKIKKTLCLVFALVFAFSAFQIFSFADDSAACSHCSGEMTVIIPDSASAEAEKKILAHFCESCDSALAAQARGITCTLFGHDLESGTTYTITHKVNSTSPRCLREYYSYEICNRCDYESYILKNSQYIVCC